MKDDNSIHVVISIIIGALSLIGSICSGNTHMVVLSFFPIVLGLILLFSDDGKNNSHYTTPSILNSAKNKDESISFQKCEQDENLPEFAAKSYSGLEQLTTNKSTSEHNDRILRAFGVQNNKQLTCQNEKECEPRYRYTFKKLLTSQLAAFWLETRDDTYKAEYLYRIQMCTNSEETAKIWFDFEIKMLQRIPRPELLDEDFISRPLFTLREPFLPKDVSYYERHFDYPLSYVIKLSDEAEWHIWNSQENESINDLTWEEIAQLSDKHARLFLPFATYMTEHLGWTVESINRYSFHEQGLLDRYRWHKQASRSATDPWYLLKEFRSAKNILSESNSLLSSRENEFTAQKREAEQIEDARE